MTQRFNSEEFAAIEASVSTHLHKTLPPYLTETERANIVADTLYGLKADLKIPAVTPNLPFSKNVIDYFDLLLKDRKKIMAIKEFRSLVRWFIDGRMVDLSPELRHIIHNSRSENLGGIGKGKI